jgi:hypothetical protein
MDTTFTYYSGISLTYRYLHDRSYLRGEGGTTSGQSTCQTDVPVHGTQEQKNSPDDRVVRCSYHSRFSTSEQIRADSPSITVTD